VRLRLLPLLCSTLLLVESGCGQSAPATPTGPDPVAPAAQNLPVPDRSQWAGKKLSQVVDENLDAAAAFTAVLKEVQSVADVAPKKDAVLKSAQALRVSRFALADLSRGASQETVTAKQLSDSNAAVAQEVARLIAIPEAKEALREAFILVRTAPAPMF